MQPIFDFLASLPSLPIDPDAAILTSVLLLSFTWALIILIRNRPALAPHSEGSDEGDIGVILENPMSLMDHLLPLRQRLIGALTGVGVGMGVSLLLADQVLRALAYPIGGIENLQVIRVTEPVSVWFRVVLTVGIILASPVILAQIWLFIASALKSNEQRLFYVLFPFAILLFLSGVAFAYFVMLPVAIPFLTTFLNFRARPTLEDYVEFVTSFLLWVGVSFEMPLIILGLAKLKIVNARMLASNWRIALVVIAVISAVITPTPDPINMGIVAAPLIVLYILSIILTLFVQ
jgi:sec-independent protein translocase protein TatC